MKGQTYSEKHDRAFISSYVCVKQVLVSYDKDLYTEEETHR